MWSISKTVGILLFLMVGMSALSSLQTLKTQSVDENYNTMDALLESRQNDIILDQEAIDSVEGTSFNSQTPGREVIRDAIIINQLSALSCDLTGKMIRGNMLYGYLGEWHSEDSGYYELETDYSIYDGVSASDNPPYYVVPGRGYTNPLVERTPGYASQLTGWNPACTGMEKTSDFVTDPLGSMYDAAVGSALSFPSDAIDYFSCSDSPGWATESGNDMEGRYGRINFQLDEDLEKPIVLSSATGKEKLRSDRAWMANFATEGGTCWQQVGITALAVGTSGATSGGLSLVAAGSIAANADFSAGNLKIIPTMAGVQWSTYAPYHSKIIDGDRNWNTNDLDLRKGHIVVDAPMYLQGSDAVDHITNKDLGSDQRALRLRERARFVLCPGTEGYIQTNREADGREGGEHTVDAENPGIGATHITTYIRVTSENPGSCMEGNEIGNIRYDEGIVFDFYPDGCKDEYNRC